MKTPAKTFCDKCKKEIPRTYGSSPYVMTLSVTNHWWQRGPEIESFDLCADCWRPVYTAMKAILK